MTVSESYGNFVPHRRLIWWTASLGGILLASMLFEFNPSIVFHFAIFVGGLFLTRALSCREDRTSLTMAFAVGYGLRFLAVLAIHQLSSSGTLLLDDAGYDQQGRYIAHELSTDGGLANLSADLGTTDTGYPMVVGFLYHLLGTSILSAKLLNAAAGALCVPVTYLLALALSADGRIAKVAAWLSSLFLYDVGWAGFLMKDTILLLCFTTLLVLTVRFLQERRWKYVVLALPCTAAVSYFRFYAAYEIAVALVLAWLVKCTISKGRTRTSRVGLACGILSMAALAGAFFIRVFGDSLQLLTSIMQQLDVFNKAGYQVLTLSFSFQSVAEFIRALVVYMLGPFGWVFKSVDITGLVFYPGMYQIYLLLPLFIIGMIQLAKRNRVATLFVLFSFGLHAVIEIYLYQAGERQRMMTDSIFVVCSALGLAMAPKRVRFILSTYITLLVVMAVQSAVGT